jgi:hypothetical protein
MRVSSYHRSIAEYFLRRDLMARFYLLQQRKIKQMIAQQFPIGLWLKDPLLWSLEGRWLCLAMSGNRHPGTFGLGRPGATVRLPPTRRPEWLSTTSNLKQRRADRDTHFDA